jgi:hypothetical protein
MLKETLEPVKRPDVDKDLKLRQQATNRVAQTSRGRHRHGHGVDDAVTSAWEEGR